MNRIGRLCPVAVAFACGLVPLAAQDAAPKHETMTWTAQVPPPPAGAMRTFEFVSAEAGIPGQVVQGAPYSATAVTETVQTLADGNKITNTMSSSIARDSLGRTRREQSLPMIAGWASSGEAAKLVTISDPVAGVSYVLNDRDKTARKLQVRTFHFAGNDANTGGNVAFKRQMRPEAGVGVAGVISARTGPMSATSDSVMVVHAEPGMKVEGSTAPKTEQLGQKDIEGVLAEGTRTTMTIAAGSIGNERPIEVVDERWYSTELQTTVMSKHSDPRMGETTYRLTKVSRAEPPPALFEVPADYRLADYRLMEDGKDTFEYKVDKK